MRPTHACVRTYTCIHIQVYGGVDEAKGLGSLGKMMHSGKLRVQKKEVKLLNQKARDRNGLTSQVPVSICMYLSIYDIYIYIYNVIYIYIYI